MIPFFHFLASFSRNFIGFRFIYRFDFGILIGDFFVSEILCGVRFPGMLGFPGMLVFPHVLGLPGMLGFPRVVGRDAINRVSTVCARQTIHVHQMDCLQQYPQKNVPGFGYKW